MTVPKRQPRGRRAEKGLRDDGCVFPGAADLVPKMHVQMVPPRRTKLMAE